MAELWDIYDENGTLTGRKMERGYPAEGDFMLCVLMFIYNANNKFLIQQRSFLKDSYPGVWDITSGAVLAGEKSIDAAKREILEELGLNIENAKIEMVGRLKGKYNFADIYFIQMEYDLNTCILQKEEVASVKSVDIDEILSIVKNARPRDEEYLNLIDTAIDKLK